MGGTTSLRPVLGEGSFCFPALRAAGGRKGWQMTMEKTSESRRLDQIPKAYDPQAVEQRLYRWWEENGYFKPRENKAEPWRRPFVISMPPPNVTGALHLGHA